jgi:hypothetical protein
MSRRKIYLDPQLVAARASEFPVIRAILASRVEDVIRGKKKRADSAPELLQLLERTGPGSHATLELFSEGIEYFDQMNPPGWAGWRGSLGGADRTTYLARRSELLIALWFADSGYEILAFEPSGAPGRLADLLVGLADDELLVETTAPGPAADDWVDEAMTHLSLALRRVDSGLLIELDGYNALTFEVGGAWGVETATVNKQEREDLVTQFAKAVDRIALDELPKVVVQPSPGQPVTIIALDHRSTLAGRTEIISSWSRSGLVPHVDRLVEKVLEERKHLPDSPQSLILVDLVRWGDFRNADYYLRQAAAAVDGRIQPAVFVGTFVGALIDRSHGVIERGVLAHDIDWAKSSLGERFRHAWAGADYTLQDDHAISSE